MALVVLVKTLCIQHVHVGQGSMGDFDLDIAGFLRAWEWCIPRFEILEVLCLVSLARKDDIAAKPTETNCSITTAFMAAFG